MRSLIFVGLACLLSSAALAQDPVPADAVAAAPAKPAKEKKLCRSEVPTGSMLSKSTCHTKEEWAAIDQANAADAERTRNARGHGKMSLN